MNNYPALIEKFMMQYRVHLMVFLIALFTAITLAHPSFFVNDEWITTNQLSQLHDGKQLMYNEGKYGTFENGTPSIYFAVKGNILGYSLFLPLISLPAYWLLDLLGNHFVLFLIFFWTFLLIIIALWVNSYFPDYARIGKMRWTSGVIVGAFVLFFLNLFYYRPLFVTGADSHIEIMAIVSTNIVLFAVLSVMIFEINRMIFNDTAYSIFGAVACISSSSYIFWTNFCKDHILVAFLFTIIVLFMVYFFHKKSAWYLCGAFIFSGLLAWERPELALFVCLSLLIIMIWTYLFLKDAGFQSIDRRLLLVSPLFTIAGAVPFFINNYVFTRNILVPASVLWKAAGAGTVTAVTGSLNPAMNTSDMSGTMISMIFSSTNIHPATFISDIYGIFFNPQTGSLGLFPIMPLVLCGIVLFPVLVLIQKRGFSQEEKRFILALLILSLGVFLAYCRDLHGMNTSVGINPDIRYLSPMYLPLNIIGLIILSKIAGIPERAGIMLKWLLAVLVVTLPLSLVAMAWYYPFPEHWAILFPLLNVWVSVGVYCMTALFLTSTIYYLIIGKKSSKIPFFFLSILSVLPLVWQINATYLMRYYGTGFGGYSFWIPVMLKLFVFIFGYSSNLATNF